MIYHIVCVRCKQSCPIINNGNLLENESKIKRFVKTHQYHGILLLDDDKTFKFKTFNMFPKEWNDLIINAEKE